MVRILEGEEKMKACDSSVIAPKSDEPFHSVNHDVTRHKPARMRNAMKSVWTEQDSVYGNVSVSRLQRSKEYSFPNRESPA